MNAGSLRALSSLRSGASIQSMNARSARRTSGKPSASRSMAALCPEATKITPPASERSAAYPLLARRQRGEAEIGLVAVTRDQLTGRVRDALMQRRPVGGQLLLREREVVDQLLVVCVVAGKRIALPQTDEVGQRGDVVDRYDGDECLAPSRRRGLREHLPEVL